MLPAVCGELHYPRIPREYWQPRLAMARAMGIEAISAYVFWNYHERMPGEFDFEGEHDIAHFLRLAQSEGMDVVLRPGPYVCAEWDFGGLPAWLLKDGEIPIRTADERFMAPARRWLQRLGDVLAPLQRSAGGPIVAVQLENEYGAFGADREYLPALRAALDAAGFGTSPYFTIDQPHHVVRGALDGAHAGITFAPGDPEREFAAVRALRPGAPQFCGEYWAGWFDRWGEPRAVLDDDAQVRDLEWMLRDGTSVNFYMFAGGTNFGFWNGATGSETQPYQPVTTSYDYQAALDEAGRPTPKYHRFREVIARERGSNPPPVPDSPRVIDVPHFTLNESVTLADVLGEPVRSEHPLPMEALGQAFGYISYRTTLRGPKTGVLALEAPNDYAVVSLDGKPIAHIDRRLHQSHTAPVLTSLTVEAAHATLEILVENGGRINYGPGLGRERKGVSSAVTFDAEALHDWEIYVLPLSAPPDTGFTSGCRAAPAFYRGGFVLDATLDATRDAATGRIGSTFLDVRSLRKGSLWVNGHNAGRFWDIGPQHSLYIPGVWLRPGFNEVIALDLFAHDRPPRISS